MLHCEQIYYGRMAPMEGPEICHFEADISETYKTTETHPENLARLLRMIKAHELDTEDSLPDKLAGRIK
tara:strand:- start:206 stop:412 length:207 start_codon:yes stop_codon:yes gene_type:complete